MQHIGMWCCQMLSSQQQKVGLMRIYTTENRRQPLHDAHNQHIGDKCVQAHSPGGLDQATEGLPDQMQYTCATKAFKAPVSSHNTVGDKAWGP